MEFRLLSAAAKEAGVSESTLRNYCRRGDLKPARDSSGRRLFDDSDVKRIRELFLDNLCRRIIA
jgi:DNA-binding transcriptional MerR regulator